MIADNQDARHFDDNDLELGRLVNNQDARPLMRVDNQDARHFDNEHVDNQDGRPVNNEPVNDLELERLVNNQDARHFDNDLELGRLLDNEPDNECLEPFCYNMTLTSCLCAFGGASVVAYNFASGDPTVERAAIKAALTCTAVAAIGSCCVTLMDDDNQPGIWGFGR